MPAGDAADRRERPRPGLTPRQIIDKLKTVKMVDVVLPATDGRTVILPRHIDPRPDTALLLSQLGLALPSQPPPKISLSCTSPTAM